MSNVKAISPKSVWTDSGEKWANYLSLTNFRDYHFDDTSEIALSYISDDLFKYFVQSWNYYEKLTSILNRFIVNFMCGN